MWLKPKYYREHTVVSRHLFLEYLSSRVLRLVCRSIYDDIKFPVHLAFGMRLQFLNWRKANFLGQSLSIVGIQLLTPLFAHGQLYVSLSRATDCENVYVSTGSQDCKTMNVVYKEVLNWINFLRLTSIRELKTCFETLIYLLNWLRQTRFHSQEP